MACQLQELLIGLFSPAGRVFPFSTPAVIVAGRRLTAFIAAVVIPGGTADEADLHAVRGTFELFTSVGILTETATSATRRPASQRSPVSCGSS